MSDVEQPVSDFDFEHWRKLAKSDPAAFEKQREKAIGDFIDGLPNAHVQERMRRLQWRVDMERRRSASALGACIRVYNMMWDSVNQNYELMQSLVGMVKPMDDNPYITQKTSKAEVLPFKRRNGTTGQ